MRLATSLTVLLGLLATTPSAQANLCGPVPDTLILFDRSGSMQQTIGGATKWSIAINAVNKLTGAYDTQLNFGLMMFARWPHVSNCSSGNVNVNVGPKTAPLIQGLLSSAYPQGDTPISLSLDKARTYLASINSGKPQYVILITDGMETCQPVSVNNPPLAAGKLLTAGVKTYVVGFGDKVDKTNLTQTATAGGTVAHYQADNLTQLDQQLKLIAAKISCCGDGKLDLGEKCDVTIPPGQPGACPTSCNDNNPCTSDSMLGAACQTHCSFNVITTPKHGDGCCPSGANAGNDSDCPANCGNGFVDVGEKCDTGIPPGQWGGCPVSCDDNNPCTKDALTGNGCNAVCTHTNTCSTNLCGNGKLDAGEWCDTAIALGKSGACPTHCVDGKKCTKDVKTGTACLTRCSYIPITKPQNGDGCCPQGATSKNDSDCPKNCGNGVLDPGETCDPGIKSGTGVCTKNCDDKDACTKDFLGGSACNVSCQHTKIGPNSTKKDGCCPKGMTSKQDVDCLPPCGPDKNTNCVNPCQGVKCKDGHYCKLGKCIPWPKDNTGEQNPNNGGIGGDSAVGGCDCRVSRRPPTGAPVAILVLFVILAVARRRDQG